MSQSEVLTGGWSYAHYLESWKPCFASFTGCDPVTRHLGPYLTTLGIHSRDFLLVKESIFSSRIIGPVQILVECLGQQLLYLADVPRSLRSRSCSCALSTWIFVIALHANARSRPAISYSSGKRFIRFWQDLWKRWHPHERYRKPCLMLESIAMHLTAVAARLLVSVRGHPTLCQTVMGW